MTPYPADYGPFILGALPYAGAEALRIAAWCIAFVAPVAAACWLLGRARRLARPSTPGIRHLHRAAANADDRHAPVTRPMSAAELDAVNGPRLGEVVSQDKVITEQWRAAFGEVSDALTPRMVAPTRADLDGARRSCHRCRTGSTAFPCTCDGDCFEVNCNGGTA